LNLSRYLIAAIACHAVLAGAFLWFGLAFVRGQVALGVAATGIAALACLWKGLGDLPFLLGTRNSSRAMRWTGLAMLLLGIPPALLLSYSLKWYSAVLVFGGLTAEVAAIYLWLREG
jgi:hypothetical protein